MQDQNPDPTFPNNLNPQNPPGTVSDTPAVVNDSKTPSDSSNLFSSTPGQSFHNDAPAPFMPPQNSSVQPQPQTVTGDVTQIQNTTTPAPVDTQPLSGGTMNEDVKNESSDVGKVVTSHVPQKYGGGKVIATIFGIMLIAGAVVAGVTLVQHRQLLEQQAASGSECDQSPDCDLIDNAPNTGSYDAPRQITRVDITDQDHHDYTPPGTDDGCRRVSISGNHVSWEKYGPGPTCKDVSNVQVWMGGTPAETATPEPTQTPTPPASTSTPTPPASTSTPTPTPPPGSTATATPPPGQTVTGECSAVVAYDTSWHALDAQSLSQLKAGKTIYLTVSGTTTSGSVDKARFTVNGNLRSETTNLKPGTTNVFYDEYTIPSGTTTFTVSAQVHSAALGWF